MTDLRFQQYLARFHNARLNRRALVQRSRRRGHSACRLEQLLARTIGASRAAPRRQIDATTLVIADDLRPGANWITFDPAWIYEINAAAGHCLNYEPLYDLPDSTKPDDSPHFLQQTFPRSLKTASK